MTIYVLTFSLDFDIFSFQKNIFLWSYPIKTFINGQFYKCKALHQYKNDGAPSNILFPIIRSEWI